jgi:hypothetical protein
LVTFKRWLWSIVEKMTPLEKQDLVFFWTGEKTIISAEWLKTGFSSKLFSQSLNFLCNLLPDW